MRALLARVARTIRHDCRVGAADRVAIAVSGGADSIALTWLLVDLAAAGRGPAVAGLIHINHQLRGAASDADEAFCRALAGRLELPIAVASVDVGERARRMRMSMETAARDVRYEFFEAAAASLGATVVATGHTMDDQAETVLLRLLRGAGTRGLSGIRIRRDRFIRPLLECRRADVRTFLIARNEPWRDDASNEDISILRNRVRRELLPVISEIARGGVRSLARIAALAQDDEAALMAAATEMRSSLVLLNEGTAGLQLDAVALSLMPAAVARRAIRASAAELAPGHAWAARHLEAVRVLAASDKPEGHLDVPGLTVSKHGGRLLLRPATPAVTDTPAADWPLRQLDVPGSVFVPETGVVVAARASDSGTHEYLNGGLTTAVLQAADVRLPMSVRNRRDGDRFRPLGAPGRRKLQDLFVDRKVPRRERDRVPVVVDASGRIVWVAGVAVAHDCRVTAPGGSVLILEQRTT
jgi:tRNA(Ile)-lysidine synthase